MWLPSDPDRTLEEISPLSGLLYPAFEIATDRAPACIEREGLTRDKHGYATLVRWSVRDRLREAGQSVEELECESRALLGLALSFGSHRFRIFKADQVGELRPPGASRAAQAFYAQQLALDLGGGGQVVDKVGQNLIILWHETGWVFKGLSLVYPRASTAWSAEWEWHVNIPFPAGNSGWGNNPPPLPVPPAPQTPPDLGIRLKKSGGAAAQAG